MCGRYTIGSGVPGEFDVRFGGAVDAGALRRYNVAPTEPVPIVRATAAGSDLGERVAGNAHWGLLAPWATSRRDRLKPINARAETLLEKRLFAPLLEDPAERVLVLADGWYEWLRSEDPRAPRVPFHHTVDDGGPFAFAGLTRTVRVADEDGGERRPLLTLAIVTCAANGPAGRIHDRMPVVLAGPEEEAAWLSADVDGRAAATLLRPLDDGRTTVRPANPLVNSVLSADGPWLLDPDAEAPAAPTGAADDEDRRAAQASLPLGDDGA